MGVDCHPLSSGRFLLVLIISDCPLSAPLVLSPEWGQSCLSRQVASVHAVMHVNFPKLSNLRRCVCQECSVVVLSCGLRSFTTWQTCMARTGVPNVCIKVYYRRARDCLYFVLHGRNRVAFASCCCSTTKLAVLSG